MKSVASKIFIYFCLHQVFIAVRAFLTVGVSRGYSLVAVLRLLIVVASFVAERGL